LPLPHDPGPHWGEVGIHGLHRQREWDAVVTVETDGVTGDERAFVVLADGRLVAEDDTGDAMPIASRISVPAPYRARAVRRDEGVWVVGVRRIETVELVDDPGGGFVELAWDGVERTVRIDGEPTLAGAPELERLGSARGGAYVVTASRLDGAVWEVSVALL
jgi:hypothetical protein